MNMAEGPSWVKGEGVLALHAEVDVEPYIARWLYLRRMHLARQLSLCATPAEVLFALAILSARTEAGLVFELANAPPKAPKPVVATSLDGAVAFLSQREVRAKTSTYRVAFALMSASHRVTVDIREDDVPLAMADTKRDQALARVGWTPLRFTVADVVRDADGCAAMALDAVGVKGVTR